MIRVLLADDQAENRTRLRTILAQHHDLEVVGEADHGGKALELVATLQPDVVLMDVHMPVINGIAATRHLRTVYPQLQIVLLAPVYHDDDAVEARQAGATSYLLTDAPVEVLLQAIRTSR